MPGIPLSLAIHRLAIDASIKPVKQKRRYFNAEQNAAVQEEVDKLLKAGFIRESRYPEWIANVVMKTANLHHLPQERLSSISTPYPFAIWGLDLIGLLPTTPGQAKHAVVAIDYFTHWVEAKALVRITEEKTTNFVKENIVCRFGTPMAITTDLGKQFDNANFREFCENRNIDLRFASVAHPQTNGLVEATNKIIKKLLKKKL
ncbi:hypothetical protein LWI28_004761 [Acer negundo]|uniref:Integrase catalytic domain-containing protein n=1 Tax=Acer negundo TaxID=4023 RepID=A0AAD5IUS0_ACENE|nr:hypothetical protein LWI28_004761 [Acer negundo]